ncbi:MAG: peptide-methionine (S)-S-oxide reductase [Methanobacteriota archaeon]|nr:MAG: peptide-methionine (S)-S-oxide reductase [Euryarchaeota archaeon]
MKTSYFAGGCYWCLEAIFRRVIGVNEVISGIALPEPEKGKKEPSAEAVKIIYNDEIVDFETLVSIFFSVHDPTTPNRQGNDIGPEYRSIVFYSDETERKVIERTVEYLMEEKIFEKPIVTEIRKLQTFSKAPEHHQRYYEKNASNSYCTMVIYPKIAKFREKFAHLYSK